METVTKIVSAGQAMLSNDMKPVSSICAHVRHFVFFHSPSMSSSAILILWVTPMFSSFFLWFWATPLIS